MNDQWYKHLIGARTIKTGIAIFNSCLCMALDLTPIYAILTAVVTIEPTAKASLIKGYRRLPATVMVQALQYYLHIYSAINHLLHMH